ncbi:MAG: hypothetical protein WC719_00010 [Patescibacteria group bacterium]|jgi:hypothetical protein
MKVNKIQFWLIVCIFVPVYVIGLLVLIWDYFLTHISGDIAKTILGVLLSILVIYSLERGGNKIVKF